MARGITTTIATLHGDGRGGEAAARCQLVVVEGPDAGRAATFGEGDLTVGTDAACHLVLTDERASRRHAVLRRLGPAFYVRDLDSRNGTIVSGAAIGEAEVPVGTTLKVGHSFLRIQPQPEPLRVEPSRARRYGDLVGESLAMREVFAVLELASRSEVTVLLEGETGTGKELAARAIHDESERRRGPFVAVDCGALPASLVESELFGHVKGAFTGAHSARKGAFARAQQGTLFLDELDAVPLDVQARLLRVLEERKVRPLGADHEVDVSLRVVAASQHDLETKVAEGLFRPDLYYRLAVLKVPLPPLRERREDLELLVKELLRRRGLDVSGTLPLDELRAHPWPGNVRELRNVVERAVALAPGVTRAADLRFSALGAPRPSPDDVVRIRTDLPFRDAKKAAVDALERRYVEELLRLHDGNVAQAAREVGMDRKHLHELLKKHGVAMG